ncbi:MAG: NGG1p interacting factor NIF3 [Campylobacterales bacterium]|nr:NGG1p interacting factor NIF3 [Campylobacterales bacterium]
MYKLTFFVPKKQKEKVKKALFKIGVGKYKNYDKCSFETKGVGQFRPLENSKPFIGKKDKIETVEEYKVEMICKDKLIKKAVKTLKKAHPYEEVAYDVIRLEEF